jgi:hypothetical protein
MFADNSTSNGTELHITLFAIGFIVGEGFIVKVNV